MRVTVQDETGELLSYDTDKTISCLCPAQAEKPAVIAALKEAAAFLGDASIARD